MLNYAINTVDCQTGERVVIEMDRREYLIYIYGLPDNTTLADAEVFAQDDEAIPVEQPPEQPPE